MSISVSFIGAVTVTSAGAMIGIANSVNRTPMFRSPGTDVVGAARRGLDVLKRSPRDKLQPKA
jgi:hypothetical protein